MTLGIPRESPLSAGAGGRAARFLVRGRHLLDGAARGQSCFPLGSVLNSKNPTAENNRPQVCFEEGSGQMAEAQPLPGARKSCRNTGWRGSRAPVGPWAHLCPATGSCPATLFLLGRPRDAGWWPAPASLKTPQGSPLSLRPRESPPQGWWRPRCVTCGSSSRWEGNTQTWRGRKEGTVSLRS